MSRVSNTANIIYDKRPSKEEIEVMLEQLVQQCIELYAGLEEQVKRYVDHKKANEGKVVPLSTTPKVIASSRRM